jgi:hypothetical protein
VGYKEENRFSNKIPPYFGFAANLHEPWVAAEKQPQ